MAASDFFVLCEPDGLAFSARVDDQSSSDDARAYFMAERRPDESIPFVRATGRKPGDQVRGSFSSQRLLSARLDEAIRRASLTGYAPYPVVLHDGRGLVPGYVGLGVSGRCGPITFGSEGRQLRVSPVGVRYRAPIGIAFDLATWDGSDLFIPTSGETMVFLTARAAQVVLSAKASNVGASPLREYEGPDVEFV